MPRYRRPPADVVVWAARRALRRAGGPVGSQAALRRAVAPFLSEKDPAFALGGARLRTLLIGVPGVRLDVRFAERQTRRALSRCPVCRGPLQPIRNRTLEGDRVVLGYRCFRCGYWTHLNRRVPVRYRFVRAGVDGTPLEP